MARDHIETFESWFSTDDHAIVAYANPSSIRDRTLPTAATANTVTAIARVEHGRWIADCPLCDAGAELVNTAISTIFCCECRNTQVAHALVPVTMPADREQIEQLLLARPDERNRNWRPGETIEQLAAENTLNLGSEA